MTKIESMPSRSRSASGVTSVRGSPVNAQIRCRSAVMLVSQPAEFGLIVFERGKASRSAITPPVY